MATSKHGNINVEEMENLLIKSIESDNRRKRENDAKLNAVQQGVPNYEAFRQLVQGCNLKPLEKKDKCSIPQFKIWNTSINLQDTKKEKPRKDNLDVGAKLPESPMEFYRAWRAAGSPSDRYAILRSVFQEGHLDKVLITDVIHLISNDLFVAMDLFDDTDSLDVRLTVEVLQRLAKENDLQVVLEFLPESDKAILNDLFEKLSKIEENILELDANLLSTLRGQFIR